MSILSEVLTLLKSLPDPPPNNPNDPSVAVIVSAVVAEQMFGTRDAGVAGPAGHFVTSLIDDYCASAPHPIGPRAAYLLGAAHQLNAIATSFGDRNAAAVALRKAASRISGRAFNSGAPASRSESAASRGAFLRRVFRELENTKMSRSEVAKGIINELQSRRLVTAADAVELEALVKIIVTARVNDAALLKNVEKKAKRILDHHPDQLTGAIAGAIGDTTRAMERAKGHSASSGGDAHSIHSRWEATR